MSHFNIITLSIKIIIKKKYTKETLWLEIPINVRRDINAINMHKNDSAIACKGPITFNINILVSLNISFNIFYNNKSNIFED